MEVQHYDPILTNCHVVKTALLYDLYRYGGLNYALQYAELVRQEKTKERQRRSRKKWLRLYKKIVHSILKGTFNIDGMNQFFKNIGVSKDELLESIIKQRSKYGTYP
jgi:hypothetical protein